jgi:tetratricopeptide (TPR) repeat protein
MLRGQAAPPGLLAAARSRLSRRSLFGRRCAREVATIEVRAGEAAGAGRVEQACALYARAAQLSGSPGDVAAAGDVLARAGDLDRADAAYRDAARAAGDEDPALRTRVEAARADLAWRRDDVAAAIAGWTAVLATQPERAEARLLQAKITAASDPALGPAARDYLLGIGDPAVALAKATGVPRPLSAYLAGRALWSRGDAAAAVRELERALRGGLPRALLREANLLVGEARCAMGRFDDGWQSFELLLGLDGSTQADLARAKEGQRRCGFLRSGAVPDFRDAR